MAVPELNPLSPLEPDPRITKQVRANQLVVDKRVQRTIKYDKVEDMAQNWTWPLAEVPTVCAIEGQPDRYKVIEGQHRVLALQLLDQNVMLWVIILPGLVPEPEQALLGHEISRQRRKHTPLEAWNQRLKAGLPHEVNATQELQRRNLRLGTTVSAFSISSVGEVKDIVHGGGYDERYGPALLAQTIDTILSIWPNHDPESSVSRWDKNILKVVAGILNDHREEIDLERLVTKMRARPAEQWKNHASGQNRGSIAASLRALIVAAYNTGLRKNRLDN